MKTSMFRICTIITFGLAASLLSAQENRGLEGVWEVNVIVTDCQGTTLRTVSSLQLYQRDGSFIETTNLASRGNSEGVWKAVGWRMYDASFWFFRYPPPQGPFASFAAAKNTITLDSDDDHFTASGTVEDLKADGTTSTGCSTWTGSRLADLGKRDSH